MYSQGLTLGISFRGAKVILPDDEEGKIMMCLDWMTSIVGAE